MVVKIGEYKIYYDKYYYDFDGVKWTPIKSRFEEPIQPIKGPKVIWDTPFIYCPYIPLSMIQVVNKYKHIPTPNDCYVGRGSPFGNPFSWLPGTEQKFRVADRAQAIQKYAQYLEWARMNDPVVAECINRLCEKALRDEPINLVCFCKPQECHGDVIKNLIEDRIKNYGPK